MLNFAQEDRQHLIAQLKTKDEQIRALNQQLDRLTQLMSDSHLSAPPERGIAAVDPKVIYLSSRRKA